MKRLISTFIVFCSVAFFVAAIAPLGFTQQDASHQNYPIGVEGIFLSQNSSTTDEESQSEQQGQSAEPEISPEEPSVGEEGFPVYLDGKTIFRVLAGGRTTTAEQRANIASAEIEKIAKDFSVSVDSFELREIGEALAIVAEEDRLIFGVTNDDALANNRELNELAEERLQTVKNSVSQYRSERSTRELFFDLLSVAIATIVLMMLIGALNLIFPFLFRRIEASRITIFHPIRIQGLQLLSADRQADVLIFFLRIVRWLMILSLLYVYIPLVMSFFPQTERIGNFVLNTVYGSLKLILNSIVYFLPNVFIIALIVITAYYLIRFCQVFFRAIDNGTLAIPGFYQEWSEPTYKLAVILIAAVAAVLVFPYIPGFDSPSFRGLSFLFGALISLGGVNAVANVIGGYITIYTRAFQLGDRVRLGEYIGIVLEKTVLSTRIRTPSNEIVTVPNSLLLTSTIVNYTATLRDVKEPLILSTTITLGYDVPWRKVHQTLVDAALACTEIVSDPAPHVVQTSLDDYYVSYELRAYTKNTIQLKQVYSELYQNIQDKCNEVDIEIMSPHYSAIRDGHQSTIPENYLPRNYVPPGFRFLNPIGQLFNPSQNPTGEQGRSKDI